MMLALPEGRFRRAVNALLHYEPKVLDSLTWGHLGYVTLLAIAFGVARAMQDSSAPPERIVWYWTPLFWICGLTVLLCAVVLTNISPRRIPRAVVLGIAVIAGCSLALLVHRWLRLSLGKAVPLGETIHVLRVVVLQWGLVTAAYYFIERSARRAAELRETELERRRIDAQMIEARLQVMQAQVEPHFLFNTLAHVQRLFQTDPIRGRSMLDSFCGYLCAALPQMRGDRSTLGREVELARAYLDTQRIRMGRRLRFEMEIPDELQAAALPPMILLPLVENAVKHGLTPLRGGGTIVISAASDGDILRITVADTGVGFSTVELGSGSGIGLSNIRSRLSALYGPNARLALRGNAPHGMIATIDLPLHAAISGDMSSRRQQSSLAGADSQGVGSHVIEMLALTRLGHSRGVLFGSRSRLGGLAQLLRAGVAALKGLTWRRVAQLLCTDVAALKGLTWRRVAQLLRAGVAALKGLTWRRVAYTMLVAAGFGLWTAFGNWMLFRHGGHGFKAQLVGIEDFFLQRWGFLLVFRVYLLLFISQMVALTVADNLRVSRVPRSVVLVTALVLGTTVGSVIVMTSGRYLDWPPVWGLTWGGLLAFVYFKRRRDEELAAALHAAQLAQVDLKKKALESQLQLMQAQVEPQFLFNTLRKIGDLYETDRPAADWMLENLILYLRAVLPQMRTSSSTLGQEVRLAQAYLNIERARLHDRFDFAFDVPERLASATFPPMVLLPVIEAIALRAPNDSAYAGALRTEARANAGELELAMAHMGASRPAIDELEGIRARVSALYGAGGKLEVVPLSPRGTMATLHIPHVAA
jgi:LytS/YehU family sensor histidine kinase